jgi:hypothetical protein
VSIVAVAVAEALKNSVEVTFTLLEETRTLRGEIRGVGVESRVSLLSFHDQIDSESILTIHRS